MFVLSTGSRLMGCEGGNVRYSERVRPCSGRGGADRGVLWEGALIAAAPFFSVPGSGWSSSCMTPPLPLQLYVAKFQQAARSVRRQSPARQRTFPAAALAGDRRVQSPTDPRSISSTPHFGPIPFALRQSSHSFALPQFPTTSYISDECQLRLLFKPGLTEAAPVLTMTLVARLARASPAACPLLAVPVISHISQPETGTKDCPIQSDLNAILLPHTNQHDSDVLTHILHHR